MVRRILVPCDGTERCAPALATALDLARQSGAIVVGLVADAEAETEAEVPADADPLHAAHFDSVALAQDAQAYVRRCAGEHGVRLETVACADPDRADNIVRAAQVQGCDLIVLGADSHPGRVLQRCAIPVLVVPAAPGTDQSLPAQRLYDA